MDAEACCGAFDSDACGRCAGDVGRGGLRALAQVLAPPGAAAGNEDPDDIELFRAAMGDGEKKI